MSPSALARAVVLSVALVPAAAAAADLAAARTLVARLAAAGRGTAAVTVTRADPLGGPDRVERGRLALEPPDRVRLDFPASGERLALRGDGGEWVQPVARQLVRLDREQAETVAWLWEVFLRGGAAGFAERPAGPRRTVLTPRGREGGLPDSIAVTLDARGLPARVVYPEPGGGSVRYDLAGWAFGRPRGPAAFTLAAPRGYTVVALP